MQSEAIEKALRGVLGASSGSEGIVITLRRHDEYEALLETIEMLNQDKLSLQQQIRGMSEYANMYLAALDELRFCRDLLNGLGVDTGFITCLRPK